jgi:tetratricopeptide (TPR) repeat protein
MALQFAYFESSLVVEYIIERYGLPPLKQVLIDLGAGVSINDALARHVAPLDRLDADFEKFAKEQANQLAPRLTWDELELEDADADAIAAKLKDNPESFPGLVQLAVALQREERWEESVEPAKLLRERFPNYVGSGNAYFLLARAYRNLENTDAEQEALEAWAERSADATDAYSRLATLAEEAGNWDAVERNALRVMAVNPLTAAPHRLLARAAEELKRPDEAITAYRALLEFDTTDPVDAHYRLAKLLHDRGDDSAAQRQVLMALEDAPRFLDAHRLLLELTTAIVTPSPEAPPTPAAAPGDAATENTSP